MRITAVHECRDAVPDLPDLPDLPCLVIATPDRLDALKRKYVKWHVKRARHRDWPQPTGPPTTSVLTH
jgi:hypothetical protein